MATSESGSAPGIRGRRWLPFVLAVVLSPTPVAGADEVEDVGGSTRGGERAETTSSSEESAEDSDRPPRRPEKPLDRMTESEANEAGFVFGGDDRAARRTAATAIAASGGLFAHGAGHFFAGRPSTGWFLLGMEAVAVALAGSGLLVHAIADPTAGASAYATTSFSMGVGLFGLSYVADVVGAAQGDELQLPANARQVRGGWLAVDYSFTETTSVPVRHVLRAETRFDFRPAYVEVQTDQDIELDLSEYGVTAGWRFWRGRRRHTFAYVEATGSMFDFRDTGAFRRWSGEARAGLSLDLGAFGAALDELVVGIETGYGRAWYRAPLADASQFRRIWAATYLPTRAYIHTNLSERLHAELSYRRRQGELLQNTRRFGGIGTLAMRYDSSEMFDLRVRGDLGGGYALTGGFAIQLWK